MFKTYSVGFQPGVCNKLAFSEIVPIFQLKLLKEHTPLAKSLVMIVITFYHFGRPGVCLV